MTSGRATSWLDRRFVPVVTRLSDNTYLSAVRAGMVAVVPLTIVGGLFTIVANPPVPGWQDLVAPFRPLLQIPVTATFGLLGVVACFSIAYDLGRRLKQEAVVSASIATVIFLMIQLDVQGPALAMDGLGSAGLFTAIVVSLFGIPIVLNPVLMVPYILNALILTVCTYALMQTGLIQKPFVNVPWTTPPIVGHYLVSGGDWRAAVWGVVSIVVAMLVYFPFAKAVERQRLRTGSGLSDVRLQAG